eukprot:m.216722 g.216722  ORF g.216722 m.216722 type:complete len:53 (+) comp39874_c0_seq12:371-529(+)
MASNVLLSVAQSQRRVLIRETHTRPQVLPADRGAKSYYVWGFLEVLITWVIR